MQYSKPINFYNYYNDSSLFQSLEIGFQTLIKIGNFFKLNYQQFLAIYAFIGLYFIKKAICRLTTNRSFALAMYFLFPFFLDVVQIRHFMAFAIGTFALTYLMKNNISKSQWIRYYIFSVIALLFHYSSIIFLFMPLSKKLKNSKVFIVSVTLTITMLILIHTGLFINILRVIGVPEVKIQMYCIDNTWRASTIGIFLYSLLQIVYVFMLYLKKIEKMKLLWKMKQQRILKEKICLLTNYCLVI